MTTQAPFGVPATTPAGAPGSKASRSPSRLEPPGLSLLVEADGLRRWLDVDDPSGVARARSFT